MSKVKDNPGINFEFPDSFGLADEIELLVPDIIRNAYTFLEERQDVKPTMEDVMLEMARRLGGVAMAEEHDVAEKLLHPRTRRRTKLEKAQHEADKLWSGRKKHVSVREMARILAQRGFASKEYLRKNLKKPT